MKIWQDSLSVEVNCFKTKKFHCVLEQRDLNLQIIQPQFEIFTHDWVLCIAYAPQFCIFLPLDLKFPYLE